MAAPTALLAVSSTLWPRVTRPSGSTHSVEETARSALGAAIGEAVFDVYPLCAYGVTDEKGRETGGFCYVADVHDWPDEALDEARAFERLPLAMQMDRPALILALHKWAGEWFDARITLERLGQPAPF